MGSILQSGYSTYVHANRRANASLPAVSCLSPSTSGRCTATHTSDISRTSTRCWRSAGRPCRLVAQAAGKRTSSVSNSLIAVLKDEIKYERESYRKDEALLDEAPNGFKLEDPPGSTIFVLGKQFGNEQIIVRVNIDQQPDIEEGEEEDEVEDEDEEGLPVEFQVTITKDGGDDVLVFDCESDGEYLTILRVALDNMEMDEPGPPIYRGPVFENLDDTLQQAFVDFLEERGVNAYLGDFIRVCLEDKSSREYQKWLGRVRKFIGK